MFGQDEYLKEIVMFTDNSDPRSLVELVSRSDVLIELQANVFKIEKNYNK
jgi:hypothetical protein